MNLRSLALILIVTLAVTGCSTVSLPFDPQQADEQSCASPEPSSDDKPTNVALPSDDSERFELLPWYFRTVKAISQGVIVGIDETGIIFCDLNEDINRTIIEGDFWALAISPDGKQLVTTLRESKELIIVDLDNGQIYPLETTAYELYGWKDDHIYYVQFTRPEGFARRIMRYDLSMAEETSVIELSTNTGIHGFLSADGDYLIVSGGSGGTLSLDKIDLINNIRIQLSAYEGLFPIRLNDHLVLHEFLYVYDLERSKNYQLILPSLNRDNWWYGLEFDGRYLYLRERDVEDYQTLAERGSRNPKRAKAARYDMHGLSLSALLRPLFSSR